MARVLLGLYDQPVDPAHPTNYDISKVGGYPDWMIKESALPLCSLCGLPSVFIGQFYCPLSGSAYHRTLYVFTCCQLSCCKQKESWIVLRSQLLTSTPASSSVDSSTRTSAADEWGSEANDWDSHEDSSEWACDSDFVPIVPTDDNKTTNEITNEIECKLHEISITDSTSCLETDSSKSECRTDCTSDVDKNKQKTTVLESCYLYVIDEPSSEEYLQHEEQLLKQYACREGLDLSSLHTVESCGERYSASEVRYGERSGDRTFYKFTKRINRCPQQLIRYSYKGEPLYTRSSHANTISRCSCGFPRIFELQLMPGLVNYLRPSANSDPVVEYLSVYVYTCERSCWTEGDTVRQEFVIVDLEDDTSLVNKALSSMSAVDCCKLAAEAMESTTAVLD